MTLTCLSYFHIQMYIDDITNSYQNKYIYTDMCISTGWNLNMNDFFFNLYYSA